jgi:hypothetical protein
MGKGRVINPFSVDGFYARTVLSQEETLRRFQIALGQQERRNRWIRGRIRNTNFDLEVVGIYDDRVRMFRGSVQATEQAGAIIVGRFVPYTVNRVFLYSLTILAAAGVTLVLVFAALSQQTIHVIAFLAAIAILFDYHCRCLFIPSLWFQHRSKPKH